jgi:TPR repeat protein
VLAAAVGVGLIIGFFGKYITDEYSPWANQSASPQANRRIALLETDAFGPLAEDLKQVPDKSPAGLAPDAVPGIRPSSGNPGRTYFNHGGQKAREGNKAEATYWYKRSVLTIEPEALTFLGDAYLNGDGVPRDARTGYQLLRMAAGFGSERARSYLMDMLASNKIPDAPPTMAEAFRGR